MDCDLPSWAAAIALAAAAAAPAARGQAWPGKQPFRPAAVFAPGGSVDPVVRMLAQPLQQQLGRAVVVGNEGGASGSIGTAAGASAPADGQGIEVRPGTPQAAQPFIDGQLDVWAKVVLDNGIESD